MKMHLEASRWDLANQQVLLPPSCTMEQRCRSELRGHRLHWATLWQIQTNKHELNKKQRLSATLHYRDVTTATRHLLKSSSSSSPQTLLHTPSGFPSVLSPAPLCRKTTLPEDNSPPITWRLTINIQDWKMKHQKLQFPRWPLDALKVHPGLGLEGLVLLVAVFGCLSFSILV